MDMSRVTLQDCVDNFEKKGQVAIINDGQVIKFTDEKSPCGNRD